MKRSDGRNEPNPVKQQGAALGTAGIGGLALLDLGPVDLGEPVAQPGAADVIAAAKLDIGLGTVLSEEHGLRQGRAVS